MALSRRTTKKLMLALLLTSGLALLSTYRTFQLSSETTVIPTGRLPAALMVSYAKPVLAARATSARVVRAGDGNRTGGADQRLRDLTLRLPSDSDMVTAFNGSTLRKPQMKWKAAGVEQEKSSSLMAGRSVVKNPFRVLSPDQLPLTAEYVIHEKKAKFSSSVDDPRSPSKQSYFLVLLVHSALNATERRKVIRSTWLSIEMTKGVSVAFWFVLGMKGISMREEQLLKWEQSEKGDLLMLWDVYNSYESLSERTLRSTHHIYTHYNFTYFLKTDDDMFLNMPILLHEMEHNRPRKRLYWGSFSCHNPPQTVGRWLETQWHSCDVYFPYAYGGMYILTRDVVGLIANNAPSLHLYSCEDVSVGSWLAPYNLHRVNDVRIFIQHGTRCSRGFIAIHVAHRLAFKLISKFYANLKKKGVVCSTLVKTEVLSWESLPGQCWDRTVTLI